MRPWSLFAFLVLIGEGLAMIRREEASSITRSRGKRLAIVFGEPAALDPPHPVYIRRRRPYSPHPDFSNPSIGSLRKSDSSSGQPELREIVIVETRKVGGPVVIPPPHKTNAEKKTAAYSYNWLRSQANNALSKLISYRHSDSQRLPV
ncbi:hypothetical protein MJO28_010731 [Puccinia striiformis f. sp. tritici]|uniref:Uncharacterized protein n=2 Tax=Puccinia striiformis TaxID=27350 RepID=A0A2S4W1G4_9BASI|nr:hypothetical protein Pst134EB_020431 [Puccinia striiformis f. sp. tritici]KAI7945036.1 hypothetical protein MJO28_010731 [Puccinia striiformis f. sp. tritici]POW15591.1 hypothetical protein PSHT_06960 [Puccinia striiformis]